MTTPTPSELVELAELLFGATLSASSFDGHCVRADFDTREEAERFLDLLDALRASQENSRG